MLQNFYSRLKDHLLGRLRGLEYDGDETEFTEQDRDSILIRNNRIYRHKTCRLNFTTYDMRRSQDSVNPRTSHRDIMVHAREDPESQEAHPFWYARTLGIFHVNVRYNDTHSEWQSVPFLWVRWFGRSETRTHSRVNPHRMDRVGFVTDSDDTEPFGFLDPAHIIRACHLIPAFAHGRTQELLSPSIVREETNNDEDWLYYYVNRQVALTP
jgi:hypothetical protein